MPEPQRISDPPWLRRPAFDSDRLHLRAMEPIQNGNPSSSSTTTEGPDAITSSRSVASPGCR